MKSKTIVASGVGAVALTLLAGAAFAQATPPSAALAPAPQITHGPALPGICVYDQDGVVATSAVGKYVDGRLKTIVAAVSSEVGAENTAIENEGKSIDAAARAPGADQSAIQSRREQLQIRYNALQRKAQLRQRELEVTERKALVRISQELNPVVLAVYQQQKCSLLIRKESAPLGNPSMDISQALVTGLNGKIQQFAFDRERLDQPAAAPAAATPPKK